MKSHMELAFLLPFWIHTCQLEAWALCQFQMRLQVCWGQAGSLYSPHPTQPLLKSWRGKFYFCLFGKSFGFPLLEFFFWVCVCALSWSGVTHIVLHSLVLVLHNHALTPPVIRNFSFLLFVHHGPVFIGCD